MVLISTQEKPSYGKNFLSAETEGFEPSGAFKPRLVSSEVPSTTQPRLQYLSDHSKRGRVRPTIPWES